MIKIGSHQPVVLPYIGIFQRIARCDYFDFGGIYDRCTKGKKAINRRIKIGTKDNYKYYSPLLETYSSEYKFSECVLEKDQNKFAESIHNQIYGFYSNYKSEFPYFKSEFPVINEIILNSWGKYYSYGLFNAECIEQICRYIGIETPILIPIDPKCDNPSDQIKNQLLWDVKSIGLCGESIEYHSGPNGREYLDIQDLNRNNIYPVFDDEFKYKIDEDLFPCSILSYIFKYGHANLEQFFIPL